MPDSQLLVCGYDLLSRQSKVRLGSWDRGAPQPTLTEIVSNVLDGSVTQGRSSANRSPSFQITVWEEDPIARADIENALYRCMNSDTWEIQWTPAGGYTVGLTCMRATMTLISTLPTEEMEGVRTWQVTCSAQPFVHSLQPITVELMEEFPVVLEDFEGASVMPSVNRRIGPLDTPYEPSITIASSSQYTSANGIYFGAASLRIVSDPIPESWNDAFTLQKSGISVATPASGISTVEMHDKSPWSADETYVRQLSPNYSKWILHITVDGVGYTAKADDAALHNRFQKVVWTFAKPIPAGTVTDWKISSPAYRFVDETQNVAVAPSATHYIDHIVMNPSVSADVSNANGFTADINPVSGSARTPVEFEIVRGDGGDFSTWCVHVMPKAGTQPLLPLGAGGGSASSDSDYHGVYEVWVAYYNPDTTNHGVNIHVDQGGETVIFDLTRTDPGYGFAKAGVISLPLVDYPPEATTTTTFYATPSYAPLYIDVLVLDVSSPTVMVGRDVTGANATDAAMAWIDRPSALADLPELWAGDDRTSAASVARFASSIDAITLEPSAASILLYSPQGGIVATMTYTPQWFQEAGTS